MIAFLLAVVGSTIIFPALAKTGLARLRTLPGGLARSSPYGVDQSTMANNTYRAPTEEETTAYKTALGEALRGIHLASEATSKAKEAIESVLGPCTYEQEKDQAGKLVKGSTVVAQRSPGEDGSQVRFTLNADLF